MGTRISLRTPAPKTDPGRTRTCNLWFQRPTPYPLGHRASASLAKLVASSPRPYSSRKIEIPRQQGPSPQTCSTSKPKPEHWKTNVALHCVNGTTPHTPRRLKQAWPCHRNLHQQLLVKLLVAGLTLNFNLAKLRQLCGILVLTLPGVS